MDVYVIAVMDQSTVLESVKNALVLKSRHLARKTLIDGGSSR